MKFIYHHIFLNHDTGLHPENRKRLISFGQLKETKVENAAKYLKLVHTADYIKKVQDLASSGGGYLDPDTYVSPESYKVACFAVGATVLASQTNNFALVRPPGHHAHPDRAAGFCLFNNIAIASQRLIQQGKKVFIFDFDGHLGDGIEEFFYTSDKVLYFSLHQSPAYPGGGSINEIGVGKGKGYTINIPLTPGSGDDIYLQAMKTFLPVAEQFKPDIVAVSAGFDGHQHDSLLNLHLSASTYYQIGQLLSQRFKNIFAALEGGYNLKYLPKCARNFLSGINQGKIKFKEPPTVSPPSLIKESKSKLQQLKTHLSPFWKF